MEALHCDGIKNNILRRISFQGTLKLEQLKIQNLKIMITFHTHMLIIQIYRAIMEKKRHYLEN